MKSCLAICQSKSDDEGGWMEKREKEEGCWWDKEKEREEGKRGRGVREKNLDVERSGQMKRTVSRANQ